MTTAQMDLSAFEATLPQSVPPVANYVPAVQTGNLVYLSGALPMKDGKLAFTGAVGATVNTEQAADAAKLCATNLLANLKAHLGTLKRVKRIVKLTGYVYSTPDFTEHAKVVNGASDFLVEVFGEAGKHSRTSIGLSSLPLGASVELDLIVEVSE